MAWRWGLLLTVMHYHFPLVPVDTRDKRRLRIQHDTMRPCSRYPHSRDFTGGSAIFGAVADLEGTCHMCFSGRSERQPRAIGHTEDATC